MAILPVLQLPKYQGSVSSILQCKSSKYLPIKKAFFSCTEVKLREREGRERGERERGEREERERRERGVASLEICLDKWTTEDKDYK